MSGEMNDGRERDSELMAHEYDGIQEYDKRLPNWWLWTLYGAIAFSLGYWAVYHWWQMGGDPGLELEARMAANALAAAAAGGTFADAMVWEMSRDAKVVAAGQGIFMANCASCHGSNLQGGIGANLVDNQWIHGGRPTDLMTTVTNGVAAKGMPTWGPVLGQKKIATAVAFVLSHHEPPAAGGAQPPGATTPGAAPGGTAPSPAAGGTPGA